jgi:predicted SAM-dependent methyltransferase
MKLQIGGTAPAPGWTILNIQPGPHVDVVGDCVDLGRFASGSVSEIYTSHVLEHLGFRDELPRALAEWHRVLEPDGRLRVSVPDLMTLCRLFVDPNVSQRVRDYVVRVMYGSQEDAHDFHKMGFTLESLTAHLQAAGFHKVMRVPDFDLFDDSSRLKLGPVPISLNVIARKPAAPA